MKMVHVTTLGAAVVVTAGVALALTAHPTDRLTALLESARTHGEWVKYTGAGGDTVMAYIAYAERADAAPAMIVIHEIFGLSDWIRTVVDRFAAEGYVAIAPDLLSRRGGTEGADDARRLIRDLPADSITVDLNATYDFLQTLRAVRGDAIGVIGFCWGGSQSFRYATNSSRIQAAVVCYGGNPPLEELSRIQTPVLGVYAERDARINAALPEVERAMRAAGKTFPHKIYDGTGHGFLRQGPEEVAETAWGDVFDFLRERVGR